MYGYDYLRTWHNTDIDLEEITEVVNSKPGYKRYYIESAYNGEELSLVGIREENEKEKASRLEGDERNKIRRVRAYEIPAAKTEI